MRALRKVFVVLFVITFLGIVGLPNASADWPEKPITLLCAYSAGGSADACSRALAAEAAKHLGQSVIVQQKTGGMGGVALTVLAGAKPDGYTMAFATTTALTRAPLLRKVNFKTLKDFTFILGCASPENALVVKKDAPWKSFKEFIAYAKENPGKVKYSTPGSGSAMNLAMLYIAKKEGIKWVHIPHKGSAPALAALLGGHVDACFSGPTWVYHEKSGAVRVLTFMGEKRNDLYPDVPILKEAGYNYVDSTVFTIVGPAGIPRDRMKKIDQAFKLAWESKTFQDTLKKLNMVPKYYAGQEYADFIKSEWYLWEKMLKDLGVIEKAATQPN